MIYRAVTSSGVRTDDQTRAIRILAIRQARKRLRSGKLKLVDYTLLALDDNTLFFEATVAHARHQDPRSVQVRLEIIVSKETS